MKSPATPTTLLYHLLLLTAASYTSAFAIFTHTEVCMSRDADPSTPPITKESFDAALGTFERATPEQIVTGDYGGCCKGFCVRAERLSHYDYSDRVDPPLIIRTQALDDGVERLRNCVGIAVEGRVALYGMFTPDPCVYG